MILKAEARGLGKHEKPVNITSTVPRTNCTIYPQNLPLYKHVLSPLCLNRKLDLMSNTEEAGSIPLSMMECV